MLILILLLIWLFIELFICVLFFVILKTIIIRWYVQIIIDSSIIINLVPRPWKWGLFVFFFAQIKTYLPLFYFLFIWILYLLVLLLHSKIMILLKVFIEQSFIILSINRLIIFFTQIQFLMNQPLKIIIFFLLNFELFPFYFFLLNHCIRYSAITCIFSFNFQLAHKLLVNLGPGFLLTVHWWINWLDHVLIWVDDWIQFELMLIVFIFYILLQFVS